MEVEKEFLSGSCGSVFHIGSNSRFESWSGVELSRSLLILYLCLISLHPHSKCLAKIVTIFITVFKICMYRIDG